MTLGKLSSREKNLAVVVAVVAFVFGNVVLIGQFAESSGQLHTQLRSRKEQLHSMRILCTQEDFWKKRDEWLLAKEPHLGADDTSGVRLMSQIKDAAKKNQVMPDHLSIGSPDSRGDYVSVSVQLETKSSWAGILGFVRDLQKPEQFIVIESSNLKIDDTDQTKIHGRLKIARWFPAPSAGGSR